MTGLFVSLRSPMRWAWCAVTDKLAFRRSGVLYGLPGWLLAASLLLSACGAADASVEPTPRVNAPFPLEAAPDGLSWEASGDLPGITETVLLAPDSEVTIRWDASGAGMFVLTLENQDADAGDSPNGNVVLALGPAGQGEQSLYLPAGGYRFVVERAESPWSVSLTREVRTFENLAAEGELLRLASEGTGSSPSFTIAEGGDVLVTWSVAIGQSLQWALVPHGDDALWPAFQTLTGEGSARLYLAPGDYHVVIQQVSGPWQLSLARVP